MTEVAILPSASPKAHRSCPAWPCSPVLRCSSHRCQPSSAASWGQGQTRSRCHGELGSGAPARSHSALSPSGTQQGHSGSQSRNTASSRARARPAGDTHLAGHRVWLPDLVAPVAAAHGHDGQLGQDDGTTDGRGHLLGALHPQPHVAVVVPDGNKRLQERGRVFTAPSRVLCAQQNSQLTPKPHTPILKPFFSPQFILQSESDKVKALRINSLSQPLTSLNSP